MLAKNQEKLEIGDAPSTIITSDHTFQAIKVPITNLQNEVLKELRIGAWNIMFYPTNIDKTNPDPTKQRHFANNPWNYLVKPDEWLNMKEAQLVQLLVKMNELQLGAFFISEPDVLTADQKYFKAFPGWTDQHWERLANLRVRFVRMCNDNGIRVDDSTQIWEMLDPGTNLAINQKQLVILTKENEFQIDLSPLNNFGKGSGALGFREKKRTGEEFWSYKAFQNQYLIDIAGQKVPLVLVLYHLEYIFNYKDDIPNLLQGHANAGRMVIAGGDGNHLEDVEARGIFTSTDAATNIGYKVRPDGSPDFRNNHTQLCLKHLDAGGTETEFDKAYDSWAIIGLPQYNVFVEGLACEKFITQNARIYLTRQLPKLFVAQGLRGAIVQPPRTVEFQQKRAALEARNVEIKAKKAEEAEKLKRPGEQKAPEPVVAQNVSETEKKLNEWIALHDQCKAHLLATEGYRNQIVDHKFSDRDKKFVGQEKEAIRNTYRKFAVDADVVIVRLTLANMEGDEDDTAKLFALIPPNQILELFKIVCVKGAYLLNQLIEFVAKMPIPRTDWEDVTAALGALNSYFNSDMLVAKHPYKSRKKEDKPYTSEEILYLMVCACVSINIMALESQVQVHRGQQPIVRNVPKISPLPAAAPAVLGAEHPGVPSLVVQPQEAPFGGRVSLMNVQKEDPNNPLPTSLKRILREIRENKGFPEAHTVECCRKDPSSKGISEQDVVLKIEFDTQVRAQAFLNSLSRDLSFWIQKQYPLQSATVSVPGEAIQAFAEELGFGEHGRLKWIMIRAILNDINPTGDKLTSEDSAAARILLGLNGSDTMSVGQISVSGQYKGAKEVTIDSRGDVIITFDSEQAAKGLGLETILLEVIGLNHEGLNVRIPKLTANTFFDFIGVPAQGTMKMYEKLQMDIQTKLAKSVLGSSVPQGSEAPRPSPAQPGSFFNSVGGRGQGQPPAPSNPPAPSRSNPFLS